MTELKHWKNKCPGHPDFSYMQYTPLSYNRNDNKEWPLLICLHGLGERGTDGLAAQIHTPFEICKPEDGDGLPFFMVAPQCPQDTIWSACIESLNDFLNDVVKELPIDISRIYITGVSMGGTATWCWALSHPERFAAVMPVCGIGLPWYAGSLKNTPVWAFHGVADPCISVVNSIDMVNSIINAGGNANLTLYNNVGHDSWEKAYREPDLFKWMLEQHQ